MIDFSSIEKYRENNRIEAKLALGGLPKSIWETYSAFANTLGGIILLGVEEYRDHSLHPVDLPNPESLVEEFWNLVNDPKKVSVNILTRNNIAIELAEGKRIIVITVPRAMRYDKPVYIDGNSMTGSYRRSGEGDYRCSADDVASMLRDSKIHTQDMRVIEQAELDVLDYSSIASYRRKMKYIRPGHTWEELDDINFLYKLGAVGRGINGKFKPTAAGLLMFGSVNEIKKEFPNYLLEYCVEADDRSICSISSDAGQWSGNVYDFYFMVCRHLEKDLLPICQNSDYNTDTLIGAMREALINSIVNADYYEEGGIIIVKKADELSISNPGSFRIDISDAKSGGVSDPRNAGLMKMFALINISSRSGSGIPSIFKLWSELKLKEPVIAESFAPERITLSLFIKKDGELDIKASGKKTVSKINSANVAVNLAGKQLIIDYLTDNVTAKEVELAYFLGIDNKAIRTYLDELIKNNIVVTEGNGKNRIYKLKA